jgi:hypothetical protein
MGPGRGTCRRAMLTRRGWRAIGWAPRLVRGAGSNDKDREALGISRGGLTSKIHLLADPACRPLARVTSAGQRHDFLAFAPLMARLKITRRGRGRPRTRPGAPAG